MAERRTPTPWLVAGLLVVVGLASPVLAHAGGSSAADGPQAASLPGWVPWAVGAGVVALSFALVGLFLTRGTPRKPGEAQPVAPGHVTGLPRMAVGVARVVGLLFLLGVIAPGIIPWNWGWAGTRLVWLGAWTALPVVAYLVGNLWLLVSPFRALAGLAERLRGDQPPYRYPERVGAWPSAILLVALVGLEVTTLGQDVVWLARLAIAYTGFTLVGMVVFGSRTWLEQAEVFDRVFAWWSTLAPVQLTREGLQVGNPLRRLGGLRARGAAGATFFVVLLYSVNFDGLLATEVGHAWLDRLAVLGPTGARLTLLVLGLGVFGAVFWGCVRAVQAAAGSLRPLGELGARVAVGLLPIAAGYHLAHAGPYLFEAAPLIWETLSDPLALNPATATAWTIPTGTATTIVAIQMVVIVLAHVLAVVGAHEVAFGAFASRVQAVKSEAPITALMVAYTVVGLWLAASGVGALGGAGG
jgi:hypothetical protein